MSTIQLSTFRSILKVGYLKVVVVIVILAIIGFSLIGNYGISSDEHVEIRMVKWNIELIAKGKPIPRDLRYYGTVFNVTAEAAYQAENIIKKKFFNNSPKTKEEQFYTRVKVKHTLTFLLALVAFAAVAGIVGILAGANYAWFGSIVFALFPTFWGHSFFNPKDIPFAAFFTVGTLLGAYLVNNYLNTDRTSQKIDFNRITAFSVLYGIFVGLATGTRVGGSFLLFFVAVTHLVVGLGKENLLKQVRRFWCFYGLMFATWAATTTIVYPASWSNPVQWFIDTLSYLSDHEHIRDIFFEGRYVSLANLPWYYLPKLALIAIPEIFTVAFCLGLVFIYLQRKRLTTLQQACVSLVLLQIFFLPTIAILKSSPSGLRHFLFVLPGIAAISAVGLIWIYKSINNNTVRLFALALTVTLLSSIVLDMVALYPYEYIYFNRIAEGLTKAAKYYETDYWGLSMREGMEWINNNASPDARVVSSQLSSTDSFANPDIEDVSYNRFEKAPFSRPFYYITKPRVDLLSKFPDCPVVHQVMRQNAPLTVVKKCG